MSFHIMDFDWKKDDRISNNIFSSIKKRNTILFLGAGASVTHENKFLSQDVIDLYEEKVGINLGIRDIIEFVDILSSNPKFSRVEFDRFVDELLRKLRPTPGHQLLAKLNWRSIITTNYDLLVERVFQEIEGTAEENLRLKTIRHKNEFYYTPSDDEVVYYKLNGCISDKKQYKLVFSSQDFRLSEEYYKIVLKPLRNVSDKINFLSIGYSYSDLFAKGLLQRMEKFDFRDRRILYSVDPFVKKESLPWFEENNVCVVNTTMEEFFRQYKEWEDSNGHLVKVSSKNYYTKPGNQPVYLSNRHLLQRIDGSLIQLNEHYRLKNISETDYYKGEEPDYTVISKHYDVVKSEKLIEVKDAVFRIAEGESSRSVPVVFLTGTFGTGKSTFAYRLVKHITDDLSIKSLAFEIIDPSTLRSIDLKELFSKSGADYIFLYVNTIEVNAVYKAMLDLRNGLSIDRSPDYKVIILATIRENMLEKWRVQKDVRNGHVINIDCSLSRKQIEELVAKLKNCGLVDFRDAQEKELIVKKINSEFNGDSFISLLELVSGSRLINDLTGAYDQLNDTAKEAFIYTSILYQFKLLMPSSLLKSLVSKEWEDFRENVIEKDGKGILIQDDSINVKHADPDLFFRTKHPLISEKLIENILRDEERKYAYVKRIITHMTLGSRNSRLVVNLLKAIEANIYLSKPKLNNLYDLAENSFGEDPYFLLMYAINLQKRRTISDVNNAIEKIVYAESFYQNRNHYLIHRRGVLCFELAKMNFEQNGERFNHRIISLLNDARDLLDIKMRLDPFSSYSFYDNIALELWVLNNLELDEIEELRIRVKLDEMFDLANKVVYDRIEGILDLQSRYISQFKFNGNEDEYFDLIESRFNNPESYPYGLILKYNFYQIQENENAIRIVEELEGYSDNNLVIKTLFVFYGRNLHNVDYRIKYFKLIETAQFLEEEEELRYNYFNFIAECYNLNFKYAYSFISGINNKYNVVNPEFNKEWIDPYTSEPQVFEGILKLNKKGKKVILIPHLHQFFYLMKSYNSLEINKKYIVTLRFFIYGIRAEIGSEELKGKEINEVVDEVDEIED